MVSVKFVAVGNAASIEVFVNMSDVGFELWSRRNYLEMPLSEGAA
jgi:hypothetical protein